MAVSSATNETKSKFGVPVTGATGSGILMPKLKYRFRVSFLNNFGGAPEAKILTQNVQNVTRPKITYEEIIIEYKPLAWIHGHVHNSFYYMLAGTHVVCNPGGYSGENPKYNPHAFISPL